jgi:hypothetical protein
MEYKGKLFGKVNKSYFPLEASTEDWDAMVKRISELESRNRALRQPFIDNSFNEGVLHGIRACNTDYQLAIQQIHKDFIGLRRITKKDMVRILETYAEVDLGDDVNPFFEDDPAIKH